MPNTLVGVRARLEKSYEELVEPDATSQEKYDLYEMLAIQILDSEFNDFPDGVLGEYLSDQLELIYSEVFGLVK